MRGRGGVAGGGLCARAAGGAGEGEGWSGGRGVAGASHAAGAAGRGFGLTPSGLTPFGLTPSAPQQPVLKAPLTRPARPQAEVFSEVSDLVQSALDGYKVCLFSYGEQQQRAARLPAAAAAAAAASRRRGARVRGAPSAPGAGVVTCRARPAPLLHPRRPAGQTGAGKTHTMQGGRLYESQGIIPRAISKVCGRAAVCVGGGRSVAGLLWRPSKAGRALLCCTARLLLAR